ncbi:MAG TPA: hypothetical protein VNO23_19995 [Candidatus Binatia bacterium]|nr:hypothetical protein [Candidatus Binatia bacterium]
MLTRSRRPGPQLHIPLRRLAMCLDCEVCFEVGPAECPACGSETWAALGRFLDLHTGPTAANADHDASRRTRQILLVARDRERLFEYLKRAFAGNDTVQVLLDRRVGERRRSAPEGRLPERRRSDRRRQDVSSQLRGLGWAVVSVDPAAVKRR